MVSGLPQRLDGQIGHRSVAGLAGVAAVEAGGDARWRKPPTLVVVGTDGLRTEIGILAERLSANPSPANNLARDQMLARIRNQLDES